MKKVYVVVEEQECGYVKPGIVKIFSDPDCANIYVSQLESIPDYKYCRFLVLTYDVFDCYEVL